MDRRFIVVLLVSLLFAAGVTGAFANMSGEPKRPDLAAAILLGTLVLLAATLYFALRGSFRERRQVEQIIEQQLGTRPWAAVAAEQFSRNKPTGRLIAWVVLLATIAAVSLYMSSVTPLLLLLWAVLVVSHARAPQESWPNRLREIAFTSAMVLLILPDDALPGNRWSYLTAAGVMLLGSIALSLRTAGTGQLAVAGVRNAFDHGDYAGVLAAARGWAQVSHTTSKAS